MYILNTHTDLNLDGSYTVYYNNIPEAVLLKELNLKMGTNDKERLKNEGEILKHFQRQGYTKYMVKGFNNPVVEISSRLLTIDYYTKN